MKTFPGLPHRMEEVGRIGRVLLVNDSKATNADAAEKALLSYDDIFWILGGKSKEGGIEPLRPLFGKVQKAYLIGASSDDFAKSLGDDVVFELCGTLDVAIERATRDAALSRRDEPVVLLSPACASYDQFPNFEVRGDRFRDLSRALIARSDNGTRSHP
jgi:UDP-N-acetylmuramoylalanine--D-glutamate ligase